MATQTLAAVDGLITQRAAPRRALVSWVLVDWAHQPFYSLILTFLFAPYFTTAVASDPAHGQALWAYAAAAGGVLIALGSPVLGAIADNRRKKPWVALTVLCVAGGMTSLWWAVPNAGTGTVLLVLAGFVIAMAAAEFTTVFTNALMPTLVPPGMLGRLSGIGWGVGFAGGLVSLIVVAGLLVANPATGKTLLGLEPLIALNLAEREGDRLVGPFAAAWLLLFIIPFFLFVPDSERTGGAPSLGSALGRLWATLKSLPSLPTILLFLIARALYADGLSAIFVFGGIYGTTVFQWQAFERGLFGIILIMAGIVGAIVGGMLDDRLGAKRVILGGLFLLLLGGIGILSVSEAHVLFSIPVTPKAAAAQPFSSIGELVFLGFAIVIALMAAPVGSASRSLMARLAPQDRIAQFFGLFAFSGKATAFMAPLLVALVTDFTASQRAGMASILIFLIAGFLLMLAVKEHRSA